MHGCVLGLLLLVPAVDENSIFEVPPDGYVQAEDLGPMDGLVWHHCVSYQIWPSRLMPPWPRWSDDIVEYDRRLYQYQLRMLACACHTMPSDRPRLVRQIPSWAVAQILLAQDIRDTIRGRTPDYSQPVVAEPSELYRWHGMGPDQEIELALVRHREYIPPAGLGGTGGN
jgi:hypothetical protein